MELENNKLIKDPYDVDGTLIDVDIPNSQRAKTSLPANAQIRSMSDIRLLQEVVAHNYAKGLKLYRGHESRDYKIESTIVRLISQKKRDCSIQEVRDAELKAFDLFCKDVFKEEWLYNKIGKSDETLFKMSIGRHLGLPCRLIDVTASIETAVWFAVMNPKYYNVDGEVVLIIFDKDDVRDTNQSPFNATKVSYSHEPFKADSLNNLPLGEQRRFIQCGHFIWVDDDSLLNEQQTITDSAFRVFRFIIPWQAKLSLAIELYRDVYSGCAYQSDIARIKGCL